jgi:hypothetical protein
MYKLYSVGDGTEPCGTPACMYLVADISFSTETLEFLCEGSELISLIKLFIIGFCILLRVILNYK